MIRNDTELQESLKRLQQDEKYIAHQHKYFKDTGLTEVQIKKALEPIVCFHQQLIDEINLYKRV